MKKEESFCFRANEEEMKNKQAITKSDVLEYIEQKILRNEYEEWEYEFYSGYKWDGMKVFKERKYKNKLRELIFEIKHGEDE